MPTKHDLGTSKRFFLKLPMSNPVLFMWESPLDLICTFLDIHVQPEIARQTYVEAEWYNTSGRVLLLVMMQLCSTCFSRGHNTQFLRCKGHSCHIPPQCRFCHSLQLSQHPIWQCWQVQSWTIDQFQAHKLHRYLDGMSHPSHLWGKRKI